MRFILALCFMLSSSLLTAETITIPVGSQADISDKPTLGMTMDSVKHQFGEPKKTSGPTGEPPITRWDYEQFSVYFEFDTVLHSVSRHTPVVTAPDSQQ